MYPASAIENCLAECAEEARELFICESVPRLVKPPSAFEFQQKWVTPNAPFIVENGVAHWPAVRKWSSKYFRQRFHNKKVTVAVTPNGFADAVVGERFVLPEEREMKFVEFLDRIDGEDAGDVFYIQKQNSNLTHDFAELIGDVAPDISWASEAFGAKPDAVNFWMGPAKAVTSMHKDHYENLYAVIAGEKEFILHPPLDRPFIPHQEFRQAQYSKVQGEWTIGDLPNSEPIPWVNIDPVNPDFKRFPMYKHARMIKCKVKAGDLFYLPSLWFHHVSQTERTIAVNYWYDMEFDHKYSYFQTLDKLSKLLGR